jgi:hypothetical protein
VSSSMLRDTPICSKLTPVRTYISLYEPKYVQIAKYDLILTPGCAHGSHFSNGAAVFKGNYVSQGAMVALIGSSGGFIGSSGGFIGSSGGFIGSSGGFIGSSGGL